MQLQHMLSHLIISLNDEIHKSKHHLLVKLHNQLPVILIREWIVGLKFICGH